MSIIHGMSESGSCEEALAGVRANALRTLANWLPGVLQPSGIKLISGDDDSVTVQYETPPRGGMQKTYRIRVEVEEL